MSGSDGLIIFAIYVFLFSFLVRLPILRKGDLDVDSYGHLYLSQEVIKQKAKPWDGIYLKCWKSDFYRHPYLWHFVVGQIPLKFLLKIEKYLNLIIDSIFISIVSILFYHYELSFYKIWILVLLYNFSPLLFSKVSIGPRLFSFTPRLSSEIFSNLFFLISFIDFGFGTFQFICAVIIGIVIIFTSKFGLQALFFITPLASIFDKTITPLIILTLSLFFSVIISQGKILKTLGKQYSHLSEYFKSNKNNKFEIYNRNNFKIFLTYLISGQYKKFIWNLVANNSFTGLLIKFPIIFFIIINLLISVNGTYQSVVLATMIIYFLTNFKFLIHLGESERYITHTVFFFLLMFLNSYPEKELVYILLLYGFLFYMVEFVFFNFCHYETTRIKDNVVIEKFLNTQPQNILLASLPYHNFSIYRAMLMTPVRCLIPGYINNRYRNSFLKKFIINDISILNINLLEDINSLTKLNILIIDRLMLKNSVFKYFKKPKGWLEVRLAQNTYLVLKKI
jgi:hypothetical protein